MEERICNHYPMSNPIPGIEHLYFFLIVKDQTACSVKTDSQIALLGYRLFAGFWWRMTGSNRRPPACKAGALPAELIPPDFWWVWMGSNHRPPPYQDGALTS